MKRELSILIVNYVSWRECVDALRSIAEHPPHRADGSRMPCEVIVVDNASPERDPQAEAEIRELISVLGGGELVMHDQNGGYSSGMNLAYARSHGEYVLVSNPDVVVTPGCIDALLRKLESDERIGASAPEVYWDEGLTCRLPPNILPTLRDLVGIGLAAISRRCLWRYSKKRTRGAVAVWDSAGDVDLPMLSGCFFLMRRALIERIGFFDERYPLYYEDTDLSRRIKQVGKRIVQVKGASLVHLYNRSGQKDWAKAIDRYWVSRRRYFRKWYGWLGERVYLAYRWVVHTEWAKRRSTRVQHPVMIDLGSHSEKPVIKLARDYERFLVEFALDPYFMLAAGTYGRGRKWVCPDSMFKGFGPTTYYFRVVDVSDPEQPVLGVYKYRQVSPQVFEEMRDPQGVETSCGS